VAGTKEIAGDCLDPNRLSLSSLAHLCRKETDRFFNRGDYDDRYCRELFRRAIQGRDELAWEILTEQYSALVKSWIQRHPSFVLADEEKEFFVNRTFDNFWYAFSRDPNKLSKFRNLKSLLQYLKLCTNSAVKEYVSRQMRPQGIPLSSTPVLSIADPVDPVVEAEEKLQARKIWQYVVSVLKSDQEKIVAEEFLIYDLKPREIFARHGASFSDVGQVRRVKENLMARLRRDRQLEAFLTKSD